MILVLTKEANPKLSSPHHFLYPVFYYRSPLNVHLWFVLYYSSDLPTLIEQVTLQTFLAIAYLNFF